MDCEELITYKMLLLHEDPTTDNCDPDGHFDGSWGRRTEDGSCCVSSKVEVNTKMGNTTSLCAVSHPFIAFQIVVG